MADLRGVLREIRDGIARNAYPNETAVRTQIVQRVLHELGWNVFDPDQVYNEYPLKLESGRIVASHERNGNSPTTVPCSGVPRYCPATGGYSPTFPTNRRAIL